MSDKQRIYKVRGEEESDFWDAVNAWKFEGLPFRMIRYERLEAGAFELIIRSASTQTELMNVLDKAKIIPFVWETLCESRERLIDDLHEQLKNYKGELDYFPYSGCEYCREAIIRRLKIKGFKVIGLYSNDKEICYTKHSCSS